MNSDQTPSSVAQASAPQLDWNLIRAFLAVVDGGSLTAAATMLAASQPTLSRQIAELESRIGAALFERVARGLRLTAVGAALVESARQIQLAAQALSLAALGNTQQLSGTVRITASEMTAAYLLPDILAGLRQSHPEIEIELVASNRIENLLERQADIALRHTRPTQGGLIARRLGDIRLGAFAHVDYLARVGGALELTRLQDYDWIGYDQSDALLRGFSAAGIKVGREFFRLRCDNHVVCWQLALSGAGISFAPCAVAQHWPQMQSVLPQSMVPPMPLWITAHRELRNSTRIQLVFQRLSEGFLSFVDRVSAPGNPYPVGQ